MVDSMIFRKAIAKAIRQGYQNKALYNSGLEHYYKGMKRELIFDHDFAKAFWGEKCIDDGHDYQNEWKHHLQQMVLEKNPLQYLEKFL